MWRFRRASRPHTTPPRARLQLEALDLRLAPSSLDPLTGGYIPTAPAPFVATTTQSSVFVDPEVPPEVATNVAPRIVNFVAVETARGLWTFSGDVIDEAPGGLTITFGGVPVSLQNRTTTTDANGHFSVAFLMNTDGSDDGTATARAVDSAGLASNLAIYIVNPS